jgi:PIN domain nuclease of toxin-antitoxin system
VTLLLDSHALLWALHAPEKLAAPARSAIEDGANPVFFSSASIWELAIKSGKGLLHLDDGFFEAIAETRLTELPVRASHSWAIRLLPAIHSDPFDRMLVAQAQIERLTLVTRDQFLGKYRVPILAA